MQILSTVMTAIIAFLATNIDDVFLLMLFFSQADHSFRRRHIIVGQYLGFVALIAISLPGFLGSFIIPKEFIGLLGLAPIAIGIRRFIRRENEIDATIHAAPLPKAPSLLTLLFHPKTYSVAAVTFANGGDNIGVYASLFASIDLLGLMVTVITFLILVAVWCSIATRLAYQKIVARVLSQYERLIVPFVLIGLGIYIIIINGTLRLIGF